MPPQHQSLCKYVAMVMLPQLRQGGVGTDSAHWGTAQPIARLTRRSPAHTTCRSSSAAALTTHTVPCYRAHRHGHTQERQKPYTPSALHIMTHAAAIATSQKLPCAHEYGQQPSCLHSRIVPCSTRWPHAVRLQTHKELLCYHCAANPITQPRTSKGHRPALVVSTGVEDWTRLSVLLLHEFCPFGCR